VRLKDGQTLIIGGLGSADQTETVKKVPLLGSVPLLGEAFKYTARDEVARELVIFITPRVILEPEQGESGEGADKSARAKAIEELAQQRLRSGQQRDRSAY
jgi:type II secretory pathway component GspD/PulD (secretin)